MSVSEVESQVHTGNLREGNRVSDKTTVAIRVTQSDLRKIALNIDKKLDLTRLFTIIQKYRGGLGNR